MSFNVLTHLMLGESPTLSVGFMHFALQDCDDLLEFLALFLETKVQRLSLKLFPF